MIDRIPILAGTLLVLLGATPGRAQESRFRVATYNIQFLNAGNNAARLQDVREAIAALNADIIGLQEIADRDALEAVFDPGAWDLVIDDQSSDDQDLAVAVRRPLRVLSGLDADDDDFLFPDEQEFFFPNRRDVLDVEVEIPGSETPLHVLVVHQKARSGGRNTTNPRRVGAAALIVEALEHGFDEVPFVLLGDFNDNPDDASLNILETGDPNATIEIENDQGGFLTNLAEDLVQEGLISHSTNGMSVDSATGALINIDHESRDRNFDLRHTDAHTGQILFDQILIPPVLLARYVAGSITAFNGAENVGASDHLPVFADFRIEGGIVEPQTTGVLIVALLPNPAGEDAGHEPSPWRTSTTKPSISAAGASWIARGIRWVCRATSPVARRASSRLRPTPTGVACFR